MRTFFFASILVLLAAGCGGGDGPSPGKLAGTPRRHPDLAKTPATPAPIETIMRNDALERAAKLAALAGAEAKSGDLGRVPAAETVETKDGAGAPKAEAPIFVEAEGGSFKVIAGTIVCTADSLGPTFVPAEKGVPKPELALRYTLEKLAVGGETVWLRPDENPVPALAGPSRVAYRHANGIEECYEARRAGIEQSFVLPSAEGLRAGLDLTIAGKLSTELTPDLEARKDDRSAIAFNAGPRRVLSYGQAAAIDAGGRKLPLRMVVRDRRLEITIDGAWLAEARFPVAVDPLIGTLISPSYSGVAEQRTDVAYSATSDRILCVWDEEYSSTDHDIIGAVYEGDGTLVKGDILIDLSSSDAIGPRVAWTSRENKFLVVWEDGRNATPSIYGRIVDSGGNTVGSSFLIYTSLSSHRKPDVGGIDTTTGGWIVVWEDDFGSTGTDFDAVGMDVSASGVPGSFISVANTLKNERTPAINQLGSGSTPFFVAWIDDTNAASTKNDLWGRSLVSPTSMGAPFAVAADINDESDPDVARNASEFAVAYGYNFAGSDPDIRAQRVTASGKSGTQEWIADRSDNETEPAISFYSRSGQTPEYLIAWKSDEMGGTDIFATRRGATNLASIIEGNVQISNSDNDHLPAATARTGSPSQEHWVSFQQLYGTTDYDPRIVRWGFVPSTAPTADFDATPKTGNAPLAVQFTNLSTNLGSSPSFVWNFGDATRPSTDRNPTHIYNQVGSYTVSLDVTGQGGLTDNETKNSFIIVTPTSTPSGPTDDFERADLRSMTWYWRTGGDADWTTDTGASHGGTRSAKAGAITHNQMTRLEITWNVTPTAGNISFFRQVVSEAGYDELVFYVDGVPQRTLSGTLSTFAQETVSVATTGNHVFSWEFSKDGSVTVGGEVCRIDDVTFPPGNAVEVPNAGFTAAPQSGAAPLTVQFTNASAGATSYSWTFGDGGTSTSADPSHTYQSAGQYTVSLVATNANGSDTETRSAYITVTSGTQPPVAAFSAAPLTGTAPLTVQFTDASTNAPTSWAWTFGDGGTSATRNAAHRYMTAGTYDVSLTVSNAAGNDTETKTGYIVVSATTTALVANFSGSPTSGNSPLTVQFNDLSTGNPVSWAWNFGDGGSSTVQRPVHTYTVATPTAFTVSLTVRNAAGNAQNKTKTDYINVLVGGSTPHANFSATPTVGTAPLVVNFTDLSTGGLAPYTYVWSFGDGATSIDQNPSHTYAADGTYSVFLQVTDAGGVKDMTGKAGYITVGPGGSASPGIKGSGGGGGGGGCAIRAGGDAADAAGALAPLVAAAALALALRRRRVPVS